MMKLQAVVAVCLLCTAVASYAQSQSPRTVGEEGFLLGAIAVLGVLLAALIVIASKLRGIVSEQIRDEVDARLLSDDSALGKHRNDQYAHEPMRRQLMQEINEGFKKMTGQMAIAENNHREEMRNLTVLMKPI